MLGWKPTFQWFWGPGVSRGGFVGKGHRLDWMPGGWRQPCCSLTSCWVSKLPSKNSYYTGEEFESQATCFFFFLFLLAICDICFLPWDLQLQSTPSLCTLKIYFYVGTLRYLVGVRWVVSGRGKREKAVGISFFLTWKQFKAILFILGHITMIIIITNITLFFLNLRNWSSEVIINSSCKDVFHRRASDTWGIFALFPDLTKLWVLWAPYVLSCLIDRGQLDQGGLYGWLRGLVGCTRLQMQIRDPYN